MSEIFLLNPKNNISGNTEAGFIPMANVKDGFSGQHTFIVRKWEEIKKGYAHFQNGDIGIAKISPCFENLKSCIFKSLPNGVGAGTSELVILRGIGINVWFYLYLLKSAWYISQGTKCFKGVVGQQRVNSELFKEVLVPLPPFLEQERIVNEINRYFSIIGIIENGKYELNSFINKAKSKILDLAIHGKLVPQDPADEPASELLKRVNPNAEITSDNEHYPQLPAGWILLKGKYVFSPLKSTKPKSDIFKYIDIDSIDNKKHCVRQIKKIAASTAPSRASRYTRKGDLLFAMVRPYLKNIAVVPENDCIASTGFYICSSNGIITNNYCYYLMISDYVITGLNQFMKGDNSPSISKRDVENWLYPIPPINEQKRIAKAVQNLFFQIDNIAENL